MKDKEENALFLPPSQKDDGVHRMALRSGKQKLPDELAYGGDQGDHLELARQALRAGELRRSISHLALAEDRTQEAWLTLLDQWMAAAGPDALELVPLFDQEYFPTLQASQHLTRVSQTSGHRMEVVPIVGKQYHRTVAVHAFLLVAQGRLHEGIGPLLRLMEVRPDPTSFVWLAR